VTKDIMYTFFI